ncbi:hypothetical protein PFISCL1PPCAC_11357 [Pristionchus fissidentatus]|uniref:Uncharacterized protein n=1 Tax=Pristionchus fissidentatus TaxID=1538716 RepID=A0AAV5VK86_9BILA|nr:hypothetical protein PFISCL1PPCAC_11357 [Pristionchus fissidentatus]
MGQKNGKIARSSESGVVSDDGFSDDEIPDVVKNKKALFNPFFRALISECYSQAHADLPARILHRCSQQRHDFKEFLEALGAEGKGALKEGLQSFLEEVISRLDDEEAVKRIARSYGRAQVPLRTFGHKPDFFASIADAIATECVFIGGQVTAASPTNTFKAWTVLVGVMFTAVRDGYYTELRKARKASPGLEGDRTLSSSKHSSLDSTSSTSNGDRPSPSISSRGSPHFNRSSSGIADDVQAVTLITVTAPPTSTTGSAARRAYKGSRSAAIVTSSSDGATSSRSCDAICGEELAHHRRDYRLPPQHRSHDLLRADSPRDGIISGRFKKNVSLDHDKRRQRLEDIGKKHSNGYLARNQSYSSSSSGVVFDPNRIIDAFMNDEPF